MKLVQNIINKTKKISFDYKEILQEKENILSSNKVTGYSLNLPIYNTCQPTKVCIETCYFAKGGTSWTPSLKKQLRTYNLIKKNYVFAGEKIIKEYDKNKCKFLRINGGGDLFEESVEMINYIIKKRSDIVMWIVTRKLDMASKIIDSKNAHIHISLDYTSINKIGLFESMQKKSKNYFYSYQAQKNEFLDKEILQKIDVLFYDNYKKTNQLFEVPDSVFCNLTKTRHENNISNSCINCTKCFNKKLRK